jgi:large subunit ribosomal protein L24
MAHKLKKGMNVIVLSGRERNKSGKILRIDREAGRVVIEGVNMIKRSTRPNQKNPQGGMIEREAALHISNVAAIDPDTKRGVRIGFDSSSGQKMRVSRSSGKVVEA